MEVSEATDNFDVVQKSSEVVASESTQEENANGDVIVTNKETIKTTNDDGSTTTTVVIKKKIISKNPQPIETVIKKESAPVEIENIITEIIEEEQHKQDAIDKIDEEDKKTNVQTVVVKKVIPSNDDNKNKICSTTTTKTIKKKINATKVGDDNDGTATETKETETIIESSSSNNKDSEKYDSPSVEDQVEENKQSEEKVEPKQEKTQNEVVKEQLEEVTEVNEEVILEEEEEEEVEEIEEDEEEEEYEESPKVEEKGIAETKESIKEQEEKIVESVEEKLNNIEISEKPNESEKEILEEKIEKQQLSMLQQQEPKVGIEQNSLLDIAATSDNINLNIKNQLNDIISDIDRIIKQDEAISQPNQQLQQPQPPKQIISNQQSYQEPQQKQVSNFTTRAETHEDGFIKKSETIERNEINDLGDGRTQIRSTETKTIIQSTNPPSVSFYNNLPSYQQKQPLPYIIPYDPTDESNEIKGHRSMSLPTHNQFVSEQTSSRTKQVDLQKIFTPASDADEILPKTNRKLYASSAFYSPNLHPTVEDQVELARRISHSLSDISNQQSKGQTMYVNRKKRSVKWVHEGEGHADMPNYNGYHHEEYKENEYRYNDKLPLKLVMNPRGQVRDFSSVRQEYNLDSGLLSPDKCAELVAGLNAPKGKGAELFAKRRKKSEKWIVDETNAAQSSPSGVTPYNANSPNILPAYSDVGRARVQLNMHQDHLTDLYAQQYGNQRVKLVKTPWEAALETGSAAAAFERELPNLKQPSNFQPQEQQQQQSTVNDYNQGFYNSSLSNDYHYYESVESTKLPKTHNYQPRPAWQPNSQRDLAYKPSIPQGWNVPPTSLSRELFVPKEIPLDGYNPPATEKYLPSNPIAFQPSDVSDGLYSNINYSTQYPPLSNTTSKLTTSNYEKSTTYSEYGQDHAIDNTKSAPSHYEMKKLFPLSSSLYQQNQISSQQQMQKQQKNSTYDSSQTATSTTKYRDFGSQKNNFPITNKSPSYYSAPPTYKPMHKWKNSSGPINNHATTNFNPSPLPYEKLAKFDNPDPDYPSLSIPLRSPSRPRNLSPMPQSYVSSSGPTESNLSGGGGCGRALEPSFPSSFGGKLSPKPFIVGKENINKCKNYNTAARGWNQNANCYKPITFSKLGSIGPTSVAATGDNHNMPYSDF